jgi:plasmanylethanolamine desaturase
MTANEQAVSSDLLPEHDQLGPLTRAVEVVSLLAAGMLLFLHAVRFWLIPEFHAWWAVGVAVAAVLLADLASGIVHWTADTWGSENLPVLGRRFLRPFRVHHVNPDDFLRRDFIDTNGDVAMLCIPILAGAFWIPLETWSGQALVVFLVAFAMAGLPTNQVHQWAHMRLPPRWVRWLQHRGIILSREQHERHHTAPFATHYCITTGWWNTPLSWVGFYPRLERLISRITGALPRSEDLSFTAEIEQRAIRGRHAH